MFSVQDPIVVEVATQQPAAAHDISIDAIITMFASAGVFLAIAAAGGLLVGAIFIAIRRIQERSAPPTPDSSHVKLRI